MYRPGDARGYFWIIQKAANSTWLGWTSMVCSCLYETTMMQFEVAAISMRQELPTCTLAAAFEANFDSAPAWARVIHGSMVFASEIAGSCL